MALKDLFRRKEATAEVIVSDVEREAELKRIAQERELRQERERVARELYERQHPVRTFAKKTAAQLGKRIMEPPRTMPSTLTRAVGAPTGKVRKAGVSRTGRTGAGRPKSTFKYSIPGRGPVPVKVYKKWLRGQRLLAQMAMQQAPQTAQQVSQYPQQTQMPPQQPQTPYRAMPTRRAGYGTPYTPPAQEQPIPRAHPQSEYSMDIDFFTSRRIVRRKPPREAWIS